MSDNIIWLDKHKKCKEDRWIFIDGEFKKRLKDGTCIKTGKDCYTDQGCEHCVKKVSSEKIDFKPIETKPIIDLKQLKK